MKKATVAKKVNDFQEQARNILGEARKRQNSNLVNSKEGLVIVNTRSTLKELDRLVALLDEHKKVTNELVVLMKTIPSDTPAMIHWSLGVYLESHQIINGVLLEVSSISGKKVVLSPVNDYDDKGVFWAEKILCGRDVKLAGGVYQVTAVNLKTVTLAPPSA